MKLFKISWLFLFLPLFVLAKPDADSLNIKRGYPIILNNDTLFFIKNRLGSL